MYSQQQTRKRRDWKDLQKSRREITGGGDLINFQALFARRYQKKKEKRERRGSERNRSKHPSAQGGKDLLKGDQKKI